jgi:DNA-binding transcriptional MerR regulator
VPFRIEKQEPDAMVFHTVHPLRWQRKLLTGAVRIFTPDMLENEVKFTQIAFSFDDVVSPAAVEPVVAAQELPLDIETEPVNVGLRIKALKEAVTPAPSPVAGPRSAVTVRTKSTRGRKPLKSIESESDLINIPPDEVLFQRQYYSIGEVADMFRVNTSLIRFWANEFDILQPRKNRKGDRHFRPVDIKNILLIHDLLRRRKLTIEGAKDFLKKNKKAQERFELIESLRKIKTFFLEVKASL